MMPTPRPGAHPDQPAGIGRPTAARPYTRADAVADALMFEVPDRLSRAFGFSQPVAVTAQAWFDAVAWDQAAEAGKPRPTGQHEATRLTEVLWAARCALYVHRGPDPAVRFRVHRVPPTGPETRALRLTLQLSLHAGDHGEPVATIGHPDWPDAGHFRLAGDTRPRLWRAVAVEPDMAGRLCPVVTVDTLDAILSDATDPAQHSRITVAPGDDGAVHVRQPWGTVHVLAPDTSGHYHLRDLGWPFTFDGQQH